MKCLFVLCLTVAAAMGQFDFLQQPQSSSFDLLSRYSQQQPIVIVVQKTAKKDDSININRILGRFVHDPTRHFQLNLLNLYRALNLSLDLLNVKCFVEISKVPRQAADLVDTFRIIGRVDSPLFLEPLIDLTFQLGKRMTSMIMGKPTEHIIIFRRDKLIIDLIVPQLKVIRFKLDFLDDFNGFVEKVNVDGIVGKKEFVRIDELGKDVLGEKEDEQDEAKEQDERANIL